MQNTIDPNNNANIFVPNRTCMSKTNSLLCPMAQEECRISPGFFSPAPGNFFPDLFCFPSPASIVPLPFHAGCYLQHFGAGTFHFACYLQHFGAEPSMLHAICSIMALELFILHAVCRTRAQEPFSLRALRRIWELEPSMLLYLLLRLLLLCLLLCCLLL